MTDINMGKDHCILNENTFFKLQQLHTAKAESLNDDIIQSRNKEQAKKILLFTDSMIKTFRMGEFNKF